MASMFAMSQGRVNEWIHTLSPVLKRALGHAHCLPERDPQNLEQVWAMCVSVDFIIDGTERPIHRPQDPVQQQDHYSGKKKRIPWKTISLSMWKIASCSIWATPMPGVSTTNVFVMTKARRFPLVDSFKIQGSKGTNRIMLRRINRRKNHAARNSLLKKKLRTRWYPASVFLLNMSSRVLSGAALWRMYFVIPQPNFRIRWWRLLVVYTISERHCAMLF